MIESPTYVYCKFQEDIEDRLSYGENHPERESFFELLENAVADGGHELKKLHELMSSVEHKVNPSRDCPDDTFSYLGLENIESDNGRALFEETRGRDVLSTSNRFYKGNIIFARLRPYLNKGHLVRIEEGVGSGELFVINPDISLLMPEYLLEFLLSELTLIQTKWILTGCSYPRLDPEDFRNLRVILPDKGMQRALVNGIKSLREDVNRLEERIDDLIMQFKNIIPSSLKIRIPLDKRNDYFTHPSEEAGERLDFVWNRPWMEQIEELLSRIGASPLKDYISNRIESGVGSAGLERGETPIVNIGNLGRDGRINKRGILYVDDVPNARLLSLNDILISRTRDAGITSLVSQDEVGFTFSQNVLRFELRDDVGDVTPEYVVSFLNSPLGQAQIMKWESGSAGKNINTKKVPKFRIPLPSEGQLRRITGDIKALWKEMQRLDDEAESKRMEVKQFLSDNLL